MQVISDYHPMHASFLFHHSILQLAYTTQACISNLNLTNASKHMWMHIQMHQTSSWACSPYLCAQILMIPFVCPNSPYHLYFPLVIYHLYFPLSSYLIFVIYFSSFSINDHKRWVSILDRLEWKWGSFSQIWFNLDYLPNIFNLVWSKDKLLHTSK